ncbi:ABATE domain-containing protein [Streptomyces sp. NPDC091299]|uniref:CGNR zinc finger domain-containing protein n=1 Tax=Streptomyces sp. NPDC091299 TaxID=3155302 RepID=UPI00342413C2
MSNEGVITSAPLLGEPLPVELMNTVTADHGRTHDALDSESGAAWLRAVADRLATDSAITAEQLDEDAVRAVAGPLRALRDALRRLAAKTTEDPRPPATAPGLARPEAIGTLNRLAQTWPELVWPTDGHPTRTYRGPGTAADHAVQLLAHQAVQLFAGPDRDRLRPCLAPNCLLFFVKNHARRQMVLTRLRQPHARRPAPPPPPHTTTRLRPQTSLHAYESKLPVGQGS